MRESADNPPENRIQKNVNERALIGAIELAGYPLQGVVARTLMEWMAVTEEWGYLDEKSGDERSLDVFGYKMLHRAATKEDLHCHVALLLECKRSHAPFVFFRQVAAKDVPEYPRIAGVLGDNVALTNRYATVQRTISTAECMGLHLHEFILEKPPACSVFSKAELNGEKVKLSGDYPYRELILPLVKATQHAERLYVAGNETRYLTMLLPIAVLDAPMLLVEAPSAVADPLACPWVRVFRLTATTGPSRPHYRWDAIDVVHAAFFSTYLRDHLLPFLQEYAIRAAKMASVIRFGAIAEDLENWEWSALSPQQPSSRRR